MKRKFALLAVAVLTLLFAAQLTWAQLKTRNVVLIVSDGLRWQEIFTGADSDLLNEKNGGIWANPEELRRKFWYSDSDQASGGKK